MRKGLIALTLAGSLAAGPTAFLDQLWSFVTSAWSTSTEDEGLGFDPDGGPAPETDAGLGFDPNG